MHVGDKPEITEWTTHEPCHTRDIKRFENRVYGDIIPAVDQLVKVRRYAVNQDQIHLGMRHTARFDAVLQRGVVPVNPREAGLSTGLPEEIVQLLVEAYRYRDCAFT